jgi:hypothetical protein
MPLRFNRRVSIIPGLRANFSKSGVSLSIGHRGLWYTVGPRGRRATVAIDNFTSLNPPDAGQSLEATRKFHFMPSRFPVPFVSSLSAVIVQRHALPCAVIALCRRHLESPPTLPPSQ